MLERLLLPEKHAIAVLMKDHDTVKALFDKFEKTGSSAAKEKLIKQAVEELKIHAVIEEEIFYPAVRKYVGNEIMNEADEEHHVARVLIAEMDRDARADDHRAREVYGPGRERAAPYQGRRGRDAPEGEEPEYGLRSPRTADAHAKGGTKEGRHSARCRARHGGGGRWKERYTGCRGAAKRIPP